MGFDRKHVRYARLIAGLVVFLGGIVLMVWNLFWIGLAMVAVALWFLSRRHNIPIIVYHSVGPDAGWLPWGANVSVRPEVFHAQMAQLGKSGWSVVPDEQIFEGRIRKHSKVLAMHFDDAYHDFHIYALPCLREKGYAATVFASTDFIDPSEGLRHTESTRGYMNAAELCAVDSEPLFKVGCHGKDHTLGPVPGPNSARNPSMWGPETAQLWYYLKGNKARWFEQSPPDIAELPAADSVLVARLMLEPDGKQETEQQRSNRVRRDLTAARDIMSNLLGRRIDDFCWPFDRVTPQALQDAKAVGFCRFTAGRRDNRGDVQVDTVSRTHIHDYAAGHSPVWVEAFVFRARVEVAAGNLLWCPICWAATIRRRASGEFLRFRRQV